MMFRFFNQQAVKAVHRHFHLSTTHCIHSMPPPYAGPPSYDTIRRRFNLSEVDPQKYFNYKRQQDIKDRGQFIDIHDIGRDPKDYDVLISDIKHEILETKIAEEIGIPYLLKVAKSQAKEVVNVAHGYMHGSKYRPIVPFVIGHAGKARWVFFLLDSTSPLTYLSVQASKLFSIREGHPIPATIGGHHHLIYMSPSDSRFTDINLLGSDFCNAQKIQVVSDYTTNRLKLHFDGV